MARRGLSREACPERGKSNEKHENQIFLFMRGSVRKNVGGGKFEPKSRLLLGNLFHDRRWSALSGHISLCSPTSANGLLALFFKRAPLKREYEHLSLRGRHCVSEDS